MEEFKRAVLENDNLYLVLDNLHLGIIAHTPERTITVFNKEAEKITGYLKEEVIGKDCHEVFQAPFCGGKCSFCDGPPELKLKTLEYPLNIITKQGLTRHVEMTVSPILDKEGGIKGVVASFRDMTEPFQLSLKAETLSNFSGIIGKNKAMQEIFRQIQDVALYTYPVHVSGETGTGKERVANAIHDISSFGKGAFVPVNCGAIPEGIVESELFGHVRGAFSGAVKERKGRFELAHQGTLFLDEVAELPLQTQVKLLRFLQEGTFEKVGGEKRISVDTRIISATNKNLKEEVKAGRFREDLFYRLNVIPVHLPPLRDRKSDIPLLASHFLKEAEMDSPHSAPEISGSAIDVMLDYHWPGNVRELKNAIQFAMVRSRGKTIIPGHLPLEITRDQTVGLRYPAEEPQRERSSFKGKLDMDSVKAAVKKTGGNKSKAARVLGVGRATLYRFLADNEEIKAYIDQI
ncbi:sigma-54 interaction domain-containing protein [Desulfospira joergensenii]|uniref:sigma-54 interaction domain-containing protein n=1 Tax=Desulfospira joergensenii TaxID=53329 RepID=UPI0003B73981|nr:sigma-54-dependent Fis family transcriptional regulator [Desulfospira joergensenii]